jgi:hypothetical protein
MGNYQKNHTLLVLLVALGAVFSPTSAQSIRTETNTQGTYTTGNRLDLPANMTKISPPRFDIPVLLDTDLYNNVSQHQDYKNNWILDVSNIDSKVGCFLEGILS